MRRIEDSFLAQLRSAFQTYKSKTQTDVSPQLWTASFVPVDDCWKVMRREVVDSDLCEPGDEGVTLTLTRIGDELKRPKVRKPSTRGDLKECE